MAFSFYSKGSSAPLRALWNSLAPPACSAERRAVLTRILRISAWVTLLAAIPPGIATAMLGDHRRSCIILMQELFLLAALRLNRSQKLEWGAMVAALGVLASA